MQIERIRALRKQKGLTQEELAKAIGVQRAVISKYETGIVDISVSQLEKIADVLGVTVDYLLGGETKTPAEAGAAFDDFTYAMYSESRGLTEENKRLLLEMAHMLKEHQLKNPNPPK